MAHDHGFSRLRLDTPAPPKRITSTFAAIPRHENGDHDLYLADHSKSAPHLPFTSQLTAVDRLLATSPQVEEVLSKRLRNGEDLDNGSSGVQGDVIAYDSAPDYFIQNTSTRGGTSSIPLARGVTNEGEEQGRVNELLPRSAPRDVPYFLQHKDTLDGTDQLDKDEEATRAGDGESEPIQQDMSLLDRRRERSRALCIDCETRQPQTFTSLEDSPDSDASARSPSLISLTTASASLQKSSTPLNDMSLAPSIPKTTSPIEFSPPPATTGRRSRRSESSRSRSYTLLNSLMGSKSSERRRSTRSAASSMSPSSAASQYLAQWNTRHPVEEVVEPDDEGQEIGDRSGYIIGRKIGYGGFSVVKEVYTMENGKRVVRAVKIVRKNPEAVSDESENERVQAEFEHEVSIWRFLKHRYILPLISVYDTPFATFCITKVIQGGTLHDLIRSRRQQYTHTQRGLSANLAKRYTYQLAAAIRYLHQDVRVVHRDIKLENCLLDMTAPEARTEGGNILLCDFGMADFIHNESRNDDAGPIADATMKQQNHHRNIGPSETSSQVSAMSSNLGTSAVNGGATLESRESTLSIMGSLEYASPELITASSILYAPSADIWAFGCVLYTLLTGSLPFSHAMREKLVVMIEKTQWDVTPLYDCPAVRESGIAGSAIIELVKGCLTVDVEDRWDIEKILGSRWLVGCKQFYGDGTDDVGDSWK